MALPLGALMQISYQGLIMIICPSTAQVYDRDDGAGSGKAASALMAREAAEAAARAYPGARKNAANAAHAAAAAAAEGPWVPMAMDSRGDWRATAAEPQTLPPPRRAGSFDVLSGSRVMEVVISVSDSGTGIEPAKFGMVFRPFSQLSNKAEASSAGTGLGLSIVKFLIEKMHGVVTFASEVGLGTSFVARIPLRLLPALHPASPEAPLSADLPLENLPPKIAALIAPHPTAPGCTAALLIPRASLRTALARMLRCAGVDVDEEAVRGLSWMAAPERGAFDVADARGNGKGATWTPWVRFEENTHEMYCSEM